MMKNLLFVPGLLFLSAGTLSAQEKINWYRGKWHEALAYAENAGRPVLVEFTAEWCRPCKMMEAKIFPQPAVAAHVNRFFVAFRADFDDQQWLAMRYQAFTLPSFVVVMPADGSEVGRFTSSREAEDFIQLTTALFKRSPYGITLDTFAKRWESRQVSLSFLAEYLLLLRHFGYDDLQKQVLETFCTTFPADSLRHPSALHLVAEYCNGTDGRAFDFLAEHRDDPVCIFKARSLLEAQFRHCVAEKSDTLLQKMLAASDRLYAGEAAKDTLERNAYHTRYLLETRQTSAYVSLMRQWAPGHLLPYLASGDPEYLACADRMAWQYHRYVTEPAALSEAYEWFQQALQAGRTPARLASAGKLARKAGRKTEGGILLREAVSLGQQQGIATDDWEKLLAEQ
jgi:thiol-disulfide isomerase/thioredoxin